MQITRVVVSGTISFPEPIISLRMLDKIIWLWGSLKFPALWLVFKTTKKLTGQAQVEHKRAFCTPRRQLPIIVYLSMKCSPRNLTCLALVSYPNEAQPITAFCFHWRLRMRGLMVKMVKSSDSELPVLDFPRARNLRRECHSAEIRNLGRRLFQA